MAEPVLAPQQTRSRGNALITWQHPDRGKQSSRRRALPPVADARKRLGDYDRGEQRHGR